MLTQDSRDYPQRDGSDRIRVRHVTRADDDHWDAFVECHDAGTPFHLHAWRKTIEECFGYRSEYLLAEVEGRIVGVLPLFLVKNILVKKALISSPFAVYGGILAESQIAAEMLHKEARHMGERLNVDYIEFRNAVPEQCVGEPNVDRYVTFLQEIGQSEEAILEAIPRKTRYMVRKSLKNGISGKSTRSLVNFDALYSNSLHRLGTPCFPREYFESLLKNFGNKVEVREYELGGKPVSAVLTLYFRDRMLPYYGGSDPEMNALAPNNFMYFDLLRWGAEKGLRIYDFGRSKRESGSYEFKAHWGMKEETLPYQVVLVRGKKLPNISPANPRFQLPIRIWKKLPLPLTRALGPILVRLVP